ncbi:hypothetical protein TVAG_436570 [Trichomonas vaginalis G3]|uniref:VPS9 domain-containing protein n=1 Tax=Trichomonas vaginalis (strain ATCC PRA-98 / G3) TaxID=412133 RepID=A2DFA5_TRIV3|nr:hypothetical protein TVAGG3_0565710 [Trichomonas vaginalis G3]EAY20833.1 hypothetical protein TVAG_436570 [Trichomonas vaginalis G3]KAI5521559.1 hypothetical protein TVAGG3_0565710 [Trichomonas vaginalis G3]|eukprot:XP_001581819.1 hypothetical protein [Trichomonas vaginalis G3]
MDQNSYIQEITDDWLISRSYMRPIINISNENSTKTLYEFLNFAFNALDEYTKSTIEVVKRIQAEINDLTQKKYDRETPKEVKFLKRKLTFLQISEKEINMFLTSAKVNIISKLKAEFESLYLLAQVNEEITPKLCFSERVISEIIDLYFKHEIERREKSQALTHTLLKGSIEYNTKYIEENAQIQLENEDPNVVIINNFEKILLDPELGYSRDIETIVDEFDVVNTDDFIKKVDNLFLKLKRSLPQDTDVKTYYGYLITYIFEGIYIKKHRVFQMNIPSYFVPKFSENKSCELGLPPSLIDFSNPLMTVYELVTTNEHLRNSADKLYLSMFEYSPIKMLGWIDEALEEIKLYMTEKLTQSGVNPGFVPFDDTFLLFQAVLSVSKIPILQSLTVISCDCVNHKMLPNNLGYAQMMLKSAYEYQMKQRSTNAN